MHPKVNVNANIGNESFAAMMKEIAEKSGRSNVIDGRAKHDTSKPLRMVAPISTDPAAD
jgi:hypothetical protein